MTKILLAMLITIVTMASSLAYQLEVVPNSKKFKHVDFVSWGIDHNVYKHAQIKFKEGSLPTLANMFAKGFVRSQLQYHSMNVFVEGLQLSNNCLPIIYSVGIGESISLVFPGSEQNREFCFQKFMDDVITNDRDFEVVHFYTRVVK